MQKTNLKATVNHNPLPITAWEKNLISNGFVSSGNAGNIGHRFPVDLLYLPHELLHLSYIMQDIPSTSGLNLSAGQNMNTSTVVHTKISACVNVSVIRSLKLVL